MTPLELRIEQLEGDYEVARKNVQQAELHLIDCEQERDECWEELMKARMEHRANTDYDG